MQATRRACFEVVAAKPGASIRDVAECAGVAHSTASYHLGRLATLGLVVAEPDGNRVRYFRPGAGLAAPERRLLGCLENAGTARVAEALLRWPRARRTELAAALGLAPSTVAWHVRRLAACGAVVGVEQGREARVVADAAALRRGCEAVALALGPGPARAAAERLLGLLQGQGARGSAAAWAPDLSPQPCA